MAIEIAHGWKVADGTSESAANSERALRTAQTVISFRDRQGSSEKRMPGDGPQFPSSNVAHIILSRCQVANEIRARIVPNDGER
jgi:hypothetical protein